jgi:hypothetical protein
MMPALLKKPKVTPPLPRPLVSFYAERWPVEVCFLPIMTGSRLLAFDAEEVLKAVFDLRPGAYGQNVRERLLEEMAEFLESWLVNLVANDQLWWNGQLQVWQYLL